MIFFCLRFKIELLANLVMKMQLLLKFSNIKRLKSLLISLIDLLNLVQMNFVILNKLKICMIFFSLQIHFITHHSSSFTFAIAFASFIFSLSTPRPTTLVTFYPLSDPATPPFLVFATAIATTISLPFFFSFSSFTKFIAIFATFITWASTSSSILLLFHAFRWCNQANDNKND